jgi:hypothetical protein
LVTSAQGLSETVHAELGHVVDAVTVPRDPARDRADVDDVGDLTGAILGCLEQVRQSGVGGVEQALGVDGDHAVPLVRVRADDRAQEHQAGVVDQDVQVAAPLDTVLHDCLGLRAVRDVGLHGQRGAAGLLDLAGEGFEAVHAAGHHYDGRAVLGEPAGGGLADAAARAGDEGDGSG